MLHVQRFSGKMHEGLNSGCLSRWGICLPRDNCGRESYSLVYFFLCLLNLHHVYDFLVTKYSNDKKEKLSSAFHMYLS